MKKPKKIIQEVAISQTELKEALLNFSRKPGQAYFQPPPQAIVPVVSPIIGVENQTVIPRRVRHIEEQRAFLGGGTDVRPKDNLKAWSLRLIGRKEEAGTTPRILVGTGLINGVLPSNMNLGGFPPCILELEAETADIYLRLTSQSVAYTDGGGNQIDLGVTKVWDVTVEWAEVRPDCVDNGDGSITASLWLGTWDSSTATVSELAVGKRYINAPFYGT